MTSTTRTLHVVRTFPKQPNIVNEALVLRIGYSRLPPLRSISRREVESHMAPQPEKEKIPINSVAELLHEFSLLREALALQENEHTWEKIDKALKRFNAVVRGGGCGGKGGNAEAIRDCFVKEWKARDLVDFIIRCLISERTKLSGTCLELLTSTTRLKSAFLPFIDLYAPSLVRLLLRPNKVYITRTSQCLNNIIRNTELPHIVPHLRDGLGDKCNACRIAVSEGLFILLGGEKGVVGSVASISDMEKKNGSFLRDIEAMIKVGAVDKEPAVRAWMKKCWPLYASGWNTRSEDFMRPLSPTVKRYLDVSGAAKLSKSQGLPSSTSAPIQHLHKSTSAAHVSLSKSVGPSVAQPQLSRSASVNVNGPKSRVNPAKEPIDPKKQTAPREDVVEAARQRHPALQERPISLHGPSMPVETKDEVERPAVEFPGAESHSRPFTIHGDANFDSAAIFGRMMNGPNAFMPLPVGHVYQDLPPVLLPQSTDTDPTASGLRDNNKEEGGLSRKRAQSTTSRPAGIDLPPRPVTSMATSHSRPGSLSKASSLGRRPPNIEPPKVTRKPSRVYKPERLQSSVHDKGEGTATLARSTAGPQRALGVSTTSKPLAESRGPKRGAPEAQTTQQKVLGRSQGAFKPKVSQSQKTAAKVPLPDSPPSKATELPSRPRTISTTCKTPSRPVSRLASSSSRPPSRAEALSRSNSRAGQRHAGKGDSKV
ncbi:hypothetical protein BT69DRAFT_437514 [Atractiella rhizophila]|nr:hypothetical protein BT69DRAFT_437514 [Atractiella rhizophila]